MKFKVGDIIKGLPARRYAVTDEDMTKAEVISATDEDMRIKILEHNRINRRRIYCSKFRKVLCTSR